MKLNRLLRILSLFIAPLVLTATPLVKSGESIAFLGDSITQQGANEASGYVRQVAAGLKAIGIEATVIPAGVSGHKSNDMLARLTADVINKNPTWMTLSCGVNDVWHGGAEKGSGRNMLTSTRIVVKKSPNRRNANSCRFSRLLRAHALSPDTPLPCTGLT